MSDDVDDSTSQPMRSPESDQSGSLSDEFEIDGPLKLLLQRH
jgi:hypothetical protein